MPNNIFVYEEKCLKYVNYFEIRIFRKIFNFNI